MNFCNSTRESKEQAIAALEEAKALLLGNESLIGECLAAGLNESVEALGAKKNGGLLSLMEGRWDVLLTNYQNIQYQQNMSGRNVSVVIRCAKSNRIMVCCHSCPPAPEPFSLSSPVVVVQVGPG